MSDPAFAVRPVAGARDWRAFHAVRRAIYRGDPAAVPPLAAEERLVLDSGRHPFWQHAERRAFVCWAGRRPVGRIVAILDRMHQEHCGDRTGFFGFFECPDEPAAAAALVEAAAGELAARGCDRMRGPVNPSMKGEFGVVVAGNAVPPAIMMAHTPAWYDGLLKGCGLAKAHDFFAFTIDSAGVSAQADAWQALARLCRRIRARHPELKVAPATAANVMETLAEITALANRVRESVWGFVPITDAELAFLTRRVARIVMPELVITVRRDGEMVGYLAALPDVNWALRRARGPIDALRLIQMPLLMRRIPRARLFGLGADKRYRRAGITALLFQGMLENAAPRFRAFEFSWIAESNLDSLKALTHVLPLQPSRTYRLYEMPLATAGATGGALAESGVPR